MAILIIQEELMWPKTIGGRGEGEDGIFEGLVDFSPDLLGHFPAGGSQLHKAPDGK